MLSAIRFAFVPAANAEVGPLLVTGVLGLMIFLLALINQVTVFRCIRPRMPGDSRSGSYTVIFGVDAPHQKLLTGRSQAVLFAVLAGVMSVAALASRIWSDRAVR